MVFELWLVNKLHLKSLICNTCTNEADFFFFFFKKIWIFDVKLNSSLWLFSLNWKILMFNFLNQVVNISYVIKLSCNLQVHHLSKIILWVFHMYLACKFEALVSCNIVFLLSAEDGRWRRTTVSRGICEWTRSEYSPLPFGIWRWCMLLEIIKCFGLPKWLKLSSQLSVGFKQATAWWLDDNAYSWAWNISRSINMDLLSSLQGNVWLRFNCFLVINYHLSQKLKLLGKCEFTHLTIILTLSEFTHFELL